MIDTTGANVRSSDGVEPAADAADGMPSAVEPQASDGAKFELPIFYINRDSDHQRRETIERQLNSIDGAKERITAVDALNVPDDLRAYFFAGSKLVSPLNPGEVGCYASHLKTLRTIVERNLDYALVLEDDAIVPETIGSIVSEVTARLPATWDVIHLCGTARRAIKPVSTLKGGRLLVRYSRVPGGAYGYLVSRAGAAKLLKRGIRYWPYDTDLRRPWLFDLQVYGVEPQVITHGGTNASVILAIGGRSRARRGIPIPSRGAWTGNPLHCPEGVFFNLRTLGLASWLRCWCENLVSRFIDIHRLPKPPQNGEAKRSPVKPAVRPD